LNLGNYYVIVTDGCASTARTNFTITSSGCCGDGMCQANEACGTSGFCLADCGICCPAGTYVNSGSCTVCPPGSQTTAVNQATSCNFCAANTFNAGGNSSCVACPANTYSNAESGKCIRCPVGEVRGTTESSCHTCGDGSYASAPCDTGGCSQCAAGTFSVDGDSSCTSCSPGLFSAAGSSTCSTCVAGTYSAAGAASCTACPSGTTSPAGATHILACM
jgi:syndecan 4